MTNINTNINYNGFIILNRTILERLGLYEKPFIFNIYSRMIERANYTNGCVYFSARFANDNFRLGYKSYKLILEEMISLNLIEEIETKKGECAQFKIIDYFKVIDIKCNPDLIKKTEMKSIEEQIEKIEIEQMEYQEELNKEVKLLVAVKKLNKYSNLSLSNLKNLILNKMHITNLTFEEQCNHMIKVSEENVIEDFDIINNL